MSPTHLAGTRGFTQRNAIRPCPRWILAGAVLAIAGGGGMVGRAYPESVNLRSVAQAAPPPASTPAVPGVPASPQITTELKRVLAEAVARFEARDAAGVLVHVSEQYRTSPLTKRLIRDQLTATFAFYDTLRARVRIDDIRMVGEHAWVWSSGEVEGRLAMVGRWMPVLSWERELEVARREDGRWRLYGYQQ